MAIKPGTKIGRHGLSKTPETDNWRRYAALEIVRQAVKDLESVSGDISGATVSKMKKLVRDDGPYLGEDGDQSGTHAGYRHKENHSPSRDDLEIARDILSDLGEKYGVSDQQTVARWVGKIRQRSQPANSTAENDGWAFAKELSDALLKVRPLGGSELFVKRNGKHYADPAYCGAAIEEMHKRHHETMCELVTLRRQSPAGNDALRPFAEWADRNRNAVSGEAADELIRLARKACDDYTRGASLPSQPASTNEGDGQ